MTSVAKRGAPFMSASRQNKHPLVCVDCGADFLGAYGGSKARKRCDTCTAANLAAREKVRRTEKATEIRAYYRLTGTRYKFLLYRARNAGLAVEFTEEQFAELVEDAGCYYCGGTLAQASFSLDRVDNSAGYTLENVVACCKACNMDKRTMSQEDYFAVIRSRVDRGIIDA